jgi:hypothetical protein
MGPPGPDRDVVGIPDPLEDADGADDHREGIMKLVADRGEELVLRAVCARCLRPRSLLADQKILALPHDAPPLFDDGGSRQDHQEHGAQERL